jgi:hypothetical protein
MAYFAGFQRHFLEFVSSELKISVDFVFEYATLRPLGFMPASPSRAIGLSARAWAAADL